MSINPEHMRMVEALLFAAKEPLDIQSIAARVPEDAELPEILEQIQKTYQHKGFNLTQVAGKWLFMTAPDLSWLLQEEKETSRKLSRAALETLAIVAYHQPITRTEIEEIRGVGLSRGVMDVLFEAGWIRPRGRRRTPGKPVTYGTTEEFLIHFGLDDVRDLPGFDEMKASGLLNTEPTGLFDTFEEDAATPLDVEENED
ncbi:SMC-Scp complex subunit ScpB [Sneathiella sp. P13V-1]|uniref:SMC-Scp complex subunit ScpB n=1 Tax=Sneathiella sp. P13V-1 TaxID=2697366 RepID=UPI00187BAF78|nr:SMC-Scp complex subunit ScpB [Sneathiella sp. P13V-1]MBE7637684.1 SMC-Scp complex subunit ScpB [Sneathiella sp. P13V-1]